MLVPVLLLLRGKISPPIPPIPPIPPSPTKDAGGGWERPFIFGEKENDLELVKVIAHWLGNID